MAYVSPMPGYDIALSVIAIMLAVGGIVLGLGYATDNKNLKDFGRGELIQTAINGVIVGALFTAFLPSGILSSTINGIASSSGIKATCQGFMADNYAICFAYNYLVGASPVSISGAQLGSLFTTSFGMLVSSSSLYVAIALIGSIKVSIGVISFSATSLLSPILNQLGYVISGITLALIGIEAQGAVLNIISLVAIPVLLPLGLVLRTFYFTRRLGGAITAISIGLFAVFPLTYLVGAQAMAMYAGSTNSSSVSSFTVNATALQSSIISSSSSIPTNSLGGGNVIKQISGAVSGFVGALEGMANGLIDYMASLLVSVFIIPTFSVMLTMVSIREMARILGSEVSFGKFDMF